MIWGHSNTKVLQAYIYSWRNLSSNYQIKLLTEMSKKHLCLRGGVTLLVFLVSDTSIHVKSVEGFLTV